jgi:hypothetical protein
MERMIDRVSWIKELVKAEHQMEESGMVEMSHGVDRDRLLTHSTLQFLLSLKNDFTDSSNAFNELKTSPVGRIKVYGIAKTHADFMLFRNGFKMIFALKAPGQIAVRFNFIGTQFMPGPGATETSQTVKDLMGEHLLEAEWGPFEDIRWTFKGQTFQQESMVRHYVSLFIKESAR